MTDDPQRLLNGFLLLIGGVFLWRQIYWQLQIGPTDPQRRSALALVIITSVVMLQYGLAVTGISPALATGTRGTVTFVLWIAAIFWWVGATEQHNRAALREARKRARYPASFSAETTAGNPGTEGDVPE